MARIERFEDIDAWQSARELTGMVYVPVCSQIQAAAVSAMSDIAEGFESQSNKMFIIQSALRPGNQNEQTDRRLYPLPPTHNRLTFQPFNRITP